jgi:hypothetical protein
VRVEPNNRVGQATDYVVARLGRLGRCVMIHNANSLVVDPLRHVRRDGLIGFVPLYMATTTKPSIFVGLVVIVVMLLGLPSATRFARLGDFAIPLLDRPRMRSQSGLSLGLWRHGAPLRPMPTHIGSVTFAAPPLPWTIGAQTASPTDPFHSLPLATR